MNILIAGMLLLQCSLSNLSIPPDPGLQTVAVEDSNVSEDVPRVGLEEMLQDMTITDRRD